MNLPTVPRTIKVPRGYFDQPEIELDMTRIDEANRRMHEARFVNPATQKELEGLFNEAANEAGKYMAWIDYEILKIKKVHDKNRARVTLGKAVEEAKRFKAEGMKMNEDIRDALYATDPDCEKSLDIMNELTTAKAVLETAFWSFVRAHKSVAESAQNRGSAPTPNLVGTIGRTYESPQANFMGKDERKSNG